MLLAIQQFRLTKIIITLGITSLVFGWLLWEHFHGGVTTHHILQRKDMPGISNWWGGLLLPIMTWLLLSKVQTRLLKQVSQQTNPDKQLYHILALFLGGLLVAIILAVSFTYNYQPFLENVPYFFLILSLFIPIYFAEFILGFVLGMTFTFGPILPTVFVLVLAAIGFLIYRFIRPLLLNLKSRLTNK